MKEIVFVLVFIQHAACLRLDGDATLALYIELIQYLLVPPRLDRACELEEAVAERALSMVDVGNNAEVAISLDRYCCNPLFCRRERLECSTVPSSRRKASKLEAKGGPSEGIEKS